jgi:hypothetical protein
MLYSKRRKNLGGGLRKRSTRKSYIKNRSNTLRIQGGRPTNFFSNLIPTFGSVSKSTSTEKQQQEMQKQQENAIKEFTNMCIHNFSRAHYEPIDKIIKECKNDGNKQITLLNKIHPTTAENIIDDIIDDVKTAAISNTLHLLRNH